MPQNETWQITTFGVASVKIIAAAGGATIGGVWLATRGATGTFAVYDAPTSAKSSAAARMVMSTLSLTKGMQNFVGGIAGGSGLVVKNNSCTGSIFWRPGMAGGV